MFIGKNMFITLLHNSHAKGFAVGAFNVFNEQTARGVLKAANRAKTPVILQVSAGTVKRLGVKALGGMINAMKADAPYGLALHLDHCTNTELAKECIVNGWDAVMMDFSHFSMEENIAKTKEVVDFAHQHGVAVEGEVGLVLGVEEDIVSTVEKLAEEEETLDFIARTGVDAIAPAVGTAHGVYKSEPKLNFSLVESLSKKETSVVIHGGTGLTDDVYRKLVDLGASKINISTAIKQAFAKGIKACSELDVAASPMKADELIEKEVEEVAYRLITLFRGDK